MSNMYPSGQPHAVYSRDQPPFHSSTWSSRCENQPCFVQDPGITYEPANNWMSRVDTGLSSSTNSSASDMIDNPIAASYNQQHLVGSTQQYSQGHSGHHAADRASGSEMQIELSDIRVEAAKPSNSAFVCVDCLELFTNKTNFDRHQRQFGHGGRNQNKPLICPQCFRKCSRSDSLKKHLENIHGWTSKQVKDGWKQGIFTDYLVATVNHSMGRNNMLF